MSFGVILVDVDSSNTLTVQLSAAWRLFAHAAGALPRHPLNQNHRIVGWVANDAFNELLRHTLRGPMLREHHLNRVLYYFLKRIGSSWPIAGLLIIERFSEEDGSEYKRMASAVLDGLQKAHATLRPTERVRVDLKIAQRYIEAGTPLRGFAIYLELVDDPETGPVVPHGLRAYLESTDTRLSEGRAAVKMKSFVDVGFAPYMDDSGNLVDADFTTQYPLVTSWLKDTEPM